MECAAMHFGEFNPLDVLATAASLQSPGCGDGGSQSEGEGEADDGAEDGIGHDTDGTGHDPDNIGHNLDDTGHDLDGIGQDVDGTGQDADDICDNTDVTISVSAEVETTNKTPTLSSLAKITSNNKHESTTFVSPGVVTSYTRTFDREVMPRVIKVVNRNGGVTNKIVSNVRNIISLKDSSKMTVTTNQKEGAPKTLTVLRINKTQNADHSYAVYSRLEKSKMDEDEGYCSRSSLGSPGQCWKSDSDMTDPDVFDGRDIECDPKSPYVVLPSGQMVNMSKGLECSSPTGVHSVGGGNSGLRSSTAVLPKTVMSPPLPVAHSVDKFGTVEGQNKSSANRKHTKIVIVSRDANLRKYFGAESTTTESTSSEDTKTLTEQDDLESGKVVTSKADVKPSVSDAKTTEISTNKVTLLVAPPHIVSEIKLAEISVDKVASPAAISEAKNHDISTDKEALVVAAPSMLSDSEIPVILADKDTLNMAPQSAVKSVDKDIHSVAPHSADKSASKDTHGMTPQSADKSANKDTHSAAPQPAVKLADKDTFTMAPQSAVPEPTIPVVFANTDAQHEGSPGDGHLDTCSVCEELRHGNDCPPHSLSSCPLKDNNMRNTPGCDVGLDKESNSYFDSATETDSKKEEFVVLPDGKSVSCSDKTNPIGSDDIKVNSASVDDSHPMISLISEVDSNGDSVDSVNEDVSCTIADNSKPITGADKITSDESVGVEFETPVQQALDNNYVAQSSQANDNCSCQPKRGELPVIDTDTKSDCMVLLPGEQKSQPVSHKVLHDLLAAGSMMKSTQTMLLPGGQLCKLQTSSGSDRGKCLVGGMKLSSSTGSLSSKAGVVYIVSSTPSRTTACSTLAGSTSIDSTKVTLSSSQCNKYIIQDDVPPVSKYRGTSLHPAKTVVPTSVNTMPKTIELGTKLCPVQPRPVGGTKDSFVVLRPGSLSTKPVRSSLIAVNTNMKSLVPGGCVLPVLINGNSSATRSLLPLATKSSLVSMPKPQSSINITPKPKLGVTNSTSLSLTNVFPCPLPLQTESVLLGSSSVTNTTSIPRSGSSLLSSHKLSPSSSLENISPGSDDPESETENKSLEASIESASTSDTDTCPTPNLSDMNDHKDELNEEDQSSPAVVASVRTAPPYEGRMTPLGFSSSSCHSTPSPGGKINIKISGGVVVDVQQEKTTRDMNSTAARSIGQVGSLTWQNMPCISPAQTPTTASPSTATPTYTGKTKPKRVRKDNTSDSLLVELKKKRSKVKTGTPSRAELYRMKATALSMSELHPLIDHDYCTFTEFSADIQSSIIATTESKLKTDRKYVKKSKAARAKFAVQSPIIPIKMEPKSKKRKYTKRKLSEMLQRVPDTSPYELNAGDDVSGACNDEDGGPSSSVDTDMIISSQVIQPEKRFRDRMPKRRYRPRNSGDKNYVKIPGSYQDEFVYYATKKQRGRPRKFQEHPDAQLQAMKPVIASLNEFEWYREMSKIDKGIKFGLAGVGTNNMSTPIGLVLDHNQAVAKGTTPIHESDVVDMVIDMLPNSGLDVTPTMDSSRILGALINEDDHKTDNLHSSIVPLSSIHNEDSNASSIRTDLTIPLNEEIVESTEAESIDPEVMAEFNRLLNSMGESDQLKILANLNMTEGGVAEEKTDKDRDGLLKEDGEGTLNNLNAYLGSYGTEPHTVTTAGHSHSQFLDLDDINDNDLLNTTDIGNIFGDLTTTSATSTTASLGIMAVAADNPTKMPASDFATFGESSCSSYSVDSNNMDMPTVTGTQSQNRDVQSAFGKPLDKRELFPDISNTVPQVSSEFGVPDLTLVNMYWNELPGLMINGVEYVRLVDIHKQVLPAKDTGILKKRCQMMGLEIINCTELQRDFLIRYMNAAKSKSCVIVAKEAAKTLIGFYVDPRPRIVHRHSEHPPKKSETSKLKVLLPLQKESEVVVCDEELTVPSPIINKASMDDDSDTTLSCSSVTTTPSVPSKSIKQKTSSRRTSASSTTATSGVTRSELIDRDIKRSARLKNKKVPYAALHSGSWMADDEPEVESHSPSTARLVKTMHADSICTPEVEQRKEYDIPEIVLNIALPEPSKSGLKTLGGNHSTKPRRPGACDELELRKLMSKQKKRKLNPKERRRIRRLREKIRKHEMRSQQEEEKHLKERREKWLKNLEKAKVKRQEKKALTDKCNQEHCYAASPEPPGDKANAENNQSSDVENNQSVALMEIPKEEVNSQNNSIACISEMTMPAVPSQSQIPLPAEPKSRTRTRTPKVIKKAPQHKLEVVHMDSVQRGQKSRTQGGTLHLAKYQSREAMCIECSTCHDLLSIRRFLKHRHHMNNPDELVEVSLPQKLELHLPAQVDSNSQEVNLWDQFTKKRQTFATVPAKRRDRSRAKGIQKLKVETLSVKDVIRSEKSSPSEHVAMVTGSSALVTVQGHLANPNNSRHLLSPDDGNRHSGRVRKRKQLHPMESYVFGHSAEQGHLETKKPRRGARFQDGLG